MESWTSKILNWFHLIALILCSFNETFKFLFWTMMGMEEHKTVDMPKFFVAELVGRVLYGIFTIVMVVVLLNMLIAMITNSFQKIEASVPQGCGEGLDFIEGNTGSQIFGLQLSEFPAKAMLAENSDLTLKNIKNSLRLEAEK